MYALEAFPDIWSLLTTTTDTTITDDISGSETKFYCVKAVR